MKTTHSPSDFVADGALQRPDDAHQPWDQTLLKQVDRLISSWR